MSNPSGDCVHFPISVIFTAKDMRKSIAFYRDTLGFQLEHCWPDEKAPMWANMLLDGQSVMLGGAAPPDQLEQMCGGMDQASLAFKKARAADFMEHKPGVGMMTYLMVKDVDAYHKTLGQKGIKATPPVTQFYGIRDFGLQDPDGYVLAFYSPVAVASCGSCGMPLADAKPGTMYCQHCTDEKGHLRPYEQVFEGTVRGYFMGMMKMERGAAEKATKEHLAKMPAWSLKK